MKILLTPEGAEACRTFAASMPYAVNSIVEDTKKLHNVYNSVSEELGSHSDDFKELLDTIKKAQQIAAEAIEALPPRLEACATAIDDYVASHPTV